MDQGDLSYMMITDTDTSLEQTSSEDKLIIDEDSPPSSALQACQAAGEDEGLNNSDVIEAAGEDVDLNNSDMEADSMDAEFMKDVLSDEAKQDSYPPGQMDSDLTRQALSNNATRCSSTPSQAKCLTELYILDRPFKHVNSSCNDASQVLCQSVLPSLAPENNFCDVNASNIVSQESTLQTCSITNNRYKNIGNYVDVTDVSESAGELDDDVCSLSSIDSDINQMQYNYILGSVSRSQGNSDLEIVDDASVTEQGQDNRHAEDSIKFESCRECVSSCLIEQEGEIMNVVNADPARETAPSRDDETKSDPGKVSDTSSLAQDAFDLSIIDQPGNTSSKLDNFDLCTTENPETTGSNLGKSENLVLINTKSPKTIESQFDESKLNKTETPETSIEVKNIKKDEAIEDSEKDAECIANTDLNAESSSKDMGEAVGEYRESDLDSIPSTYSEISLDLVEQDRAVKETSSVGSDLNIVSDLNMEMDDYEFVATIAAAVGAKDIDVDILENVDVSSDNSDHLTPSTLSSKPTKPGKNENDIAVSSGLQDQNNNNMNNQNDNVDIKTISVSSDNSADTCVPIGPQQVLTDDNNNIQPSTGTAQFIDNGSTANFSNNSRDRDTQGSDVERISPEVFRMTQFSPTEMYATEHTMGYSDEHHWTQQPAPAALHSTLNTPDILYSEDSSCSPHQHLNQFLHNTQDTSLPIFTNDLQNSAMHNPIKPRGVKRQIDMMGVDNCMSESCISTSLPLPTPAASNLMNQGRPPDISTWTAVSSTAHMRAYADLNVNTDSTSLWNKPTCAVPPYLSNSNNMNRSLSTSHTGPNSYNQSGPGTPQMFSETVYPSRAYSHVDVYNNNTYNQQVYGINAGLQFSQPGLEGAGLHPAGNHRMLPVPGNLGFMFPRYSSSAGGLMLRMVPPQRPDCQYSVYTQYQPAEESSAMYPQRLASYLQPVVSQHLPSATITRPPLQHPTPIMDSSNEYVAGPAGNDREHDQSGMCSVTPTGISTSAVQDSPQIPQNLNAQVHPVSAHLKIKKEHFSEIYMRSSEASDAISASLALDLSKKTAKKLKTSAELRAADRCSTGVVRPQAAQRPLQPIGEPGIPVAAFLNRMQAPTLTYNGSMLIPYINSIFSAMANFKRTQTSTRTQENSTSPSSTDNLSDLSTSLDTTATIEQPVPTGLVNNTSNNNNNIGQVHKARQVLPQPQQSLPTNRPTDASPGSALRPRLPGQVNIGQQPMPIIRSALPLYETPIRYPIKPLVNLVTYAGNQPILANKMQYNCSPGNTMGLMTYSSTSQGGPSTQPAPCSQQLRAGMLVPSPANIPVPGPAKTLVPSPANMPIPSPIIMPVPSPANKLLCSSANKPVTSPANTLLPGSANIPIPSPANMLVPSPANIQIPSPANVPVPSPAYMPVQSPANIPAPSPAIIPVPSPANIPVPSPANVLVPSPANVLVPSPANMPVPSSPPRPVDNMLQTSTDHVEDINNNMFGVSHANQGLQGSNLNQGDPLASDNGINNNTKDMQPADFSAVLRQQIQAMRSKCGMTAAGAAGVRGPGSQTQEETFTATPLNTQRGLVTYDPVPEPLSLSHWEKKTTFKARHFNFTRITVGNYEYQVDMRAIDRTARMKLMYKKRQMVYEFQLNNQGPGLVATRQMLEIVVPFDSIVSLWLYNKEMMLEVDQIPRVYMGSRSVERNHGNRLCHAAIYSRKACSSVPQQEVAKSPYHHVMFKTLCADKIRGELSQYDPRFASMLKLPLIKDPGKTLTQQSKPMTLLNNSHHGARDSNNNPGVSGSVKCGGFPVISAAMLVSCGCTGGCSDVTCPCCVKGVTCTEGVCGCVSCRNPLNVLHQLGLPATQARTDPCLMENIYQIQRLDCYVQTHMVLECCRLPVLLIECIPGEKKCPSCETRFKYSWCTAQLCREAETPRNHCLKCGMCTDHRNTHCQNCNVCYFSGQNRTFKCPICHGQPQVNAIGDASSDSDTQDVPD